MTSCRIWLLSHSKRTSDQTGCIFVINNKKAAEEVFRRSFFETDALPVNFALRAAADLSPAHKHPVWLAICLFPQFGPCCPWSLPSCPLQRAPSSLFLFRLLRSKQVWEPLSAPSSYSRRWGVPGGLRPCRLSHAGAQLFQQKLLFSLFIIEIVPRWEQQ